MSGPASQLEQLKKFTVVVADTGDFESMKQFTPRDATTNPSLILAAAGKPEYADIVSKAVRDHQASGLTGQAKMDSILDHVLVYFGHEILKIVPGRVSTETDARLAFDAQGIVDKAKRLIGLYDKQGIDRERVLIKIASTWEGIQAARMLEKEGIHCNLTLLFSLTQAVACAEAGVKLISPFVGRILDWFKAKEKKEYAPHEDPGVQSVTEIFHYYKKFQYSTEVMGASFRNKGEIVELAGCDLLTISPALLGELAASSEPLARKLDASTSPDYPLKKITLDEKTFRFDLNQNAMATEKTSEGIRKFVEDALKLEQLIQTKL